MFNCFLLLILVQPFIALVFSIYSDLIYTITLHVFLVIWILRKGLRPACDRTAMFALAFFLATLPISYLISSNHSLAIARLDQYLIGVILLFICQSLSLKERNRVIIALVTAGLMISIAVIYQYSLLSEKTLQTLNQEINPVILEAINQKRISFPFRTPNSLGGYLILIIPLAMTFRYRLWIVFPLGVALLMTKSIGAMGSLFLVLFIYLYLQEKISRKEILLLSGALLAFSLIAFLRSFALPDHLQPFFSMKMRFTYWLETLRIIQSHPWMGVGIGDFDLPNSRHSHNMILQLWAEMGIFALLSFLTAIVAILRTGLTAFKNSPDKIKILGLICASFVFLVHNLIEFTFFLPEISVLWFMIMGLLSNTNDRLRPAKAPSS